MIVGYLKYLHYTVWFFDLVTILDGYLRGICLTLQYNVCERVTILKFFAK